MFVRASFPLPHYSTHQSRLFSKAAEIKLWINCGVQWSIAKKIMWIFRKSGRTQFSTEMQILLSSRPSALELFLPGMLKLACNKNAKLSWTRGFSNGSILHMDNSHAQWAHQINLSQNALSSGLKAVWKLSILQTINIFHVDSSIEEALYIYYWTQMGNWMGELLISQFGIWLTWLAKLSGVEGCHRKGLFFS